MAAAQLSRIIRNVSSSEFTIAYDGEALKDHRIDVRDLSPALFAIGQLFQEANQILNAEDASVKVYVKATGEGSVEVVLEVAQSIGKQVVGVLTGDKVVAALNLRELLFGTLGLFVLLKGLRGRKPKQLEVRNGTLVVEVDGQRFEVAREVIKLAESVAVRKEATKILEPLRRDGIDRFNVLPKHGAAPLVEILKEDVEFFVVPEIDITEELPETSWRKAYSIVSLAFKEERKWRLTDGTSQISATISDPDFLKKVDAGLSFSKGDILVCQILCRQVHGPEGVRSDYEVTKVVEHRQAPRQIRLLG